MKALTYLMSFLALLAGLFYLYGIVQAGIASIAPGGKLNDLWVTFITIIGSVLATNFGAVLGISVTAPAVSPPGILPAPRFMLFQLGPAAQRSIELQNNDHTHLDTKPQKIQIIACWVYILSLLVAAVLWIIATSKDSKTVQPVIVQLFYTLIGVVAGALTVALGNKNAPASQATQQRLQNVQKIGAMIMCLIVGSITQAQVTTLVPEFKFRSGFRTESSTADSNELIKSLSFVRIGGLGNISNSVNTTDIDPSANINVEFALPGKIHFEKNLRLYLNYNIGSSQDSADIDSIKLGSFFFPDKSKNGFAAGLSMDLARLFEKLRKYSIERPMKIEASKKYVFYMLEPYVEYSYQRRNVKDIKATAPRIESSMWLFGIRASLRYILDENNFAVTFNLYKKSLVFTNATFPYYNNVFQKTNNNQPLPQKNALWGLNVGMQLNKAILGFTYEGLITKGVISNDISGGVFILRATISADFFDFK